MIIGSCLLVSMGCYRRRRVETESNASIVDNQRETLAGLGYGLAAYTMWGVFPLYFRTLPHVSPWVIIGRRILWSAVFLAVIVSIRRE